MADSRSSSGSALRQLHWPTVAVTLTVSAVTTVVYRTAANLWQLRRQRNAAAKNRASASAENSNTAGVSSAAVESECSSAVGASLLNFLLMSGRCKTEKRTGWVNSGVPLPESVADHQWRSDSTQLSRIATSCRERLTCIRCRVAARQNVTHGTQLRRLRGAAFRSMQLRCIRGCCCSECGTRVPRSCSAHVSRSRSC